MGGICDKEVAARGEESERVVVDLCGVEEYEFVTEDMERDALLLAE